jgi:hypothetical protein
MVCADEVAVSAVAVPESLIENLIPLKTPTQAAVGTEGEESTPVDAFRVKQEGNVPAATAQFLYGGMPPVPASVAEYAVPTATDCWAAVRLVIAGAAGTVIVAVPGVADGLATDVAVTVTVCAELVAAGSVIVAEVVVVFDRVPALVLQLTPAAFLSFVTVAVRVVVSVPSTVVAAAVTVTLGVGGVAGDELPPQPAVNSTDNKDVRIPRHNTARFSSRMTTSETGKYSRSDY